MTRQLTASLEAGDALLSIAVPVREEAGSHLAGGGRSLFQHGEPTYAVEGDSVSEEELARQFGQNVLEELTDLAFDDGTLTEEWDGLLD